MNEELDAPKIIPSVRFKIRLHLAGVLVMREIYTIAHIKSDLNLTSRYNDEAYLADNNNVIMSIIYLTRWKVESAY